MDICFEKQDKPTAFFVLGKEVILDDERLAAALSRLPKLRREAELVDKKAKDLQADIIHLSLNLIDKRNYYLYN